MSSGLKVRLPLLAAAALGLWLWQSGPFSQPRELVLMLPQGRTPAASVEIQLYSEKGELLRRDERFFRTADAPSVLREEIALAPGRYLCRVFVRDTQGATISLSRSVDVGSERTYHLDLKPSGGASGGGGSGP